MGLSFLGMFWFAGTAVCVALTVRAVPRHGTLLALGLTALVLVALQVLHVTALSACPPDGCGTMAPLLDRIRASLAALTGAGAAVGLWMGHRILRRM